MSAKHCLTHMLQGACCGAAATGPMTVAMHFLQRLLPCDHREPLEHRQITDTVLYGITQNSSLADSDHRRIAMAAHLGFGSAMGAAYPFVARMCRNIPTRGMAYGMAVFTASYAGWLPAMGILPPPQRRPWGRSVLLVASHLIWGATLQRLYAPFEDGDVMLRETSTLRPIAAHPPNG